MLWCKVVDGWRRAEDLHFRQERVPGTGAIAHMTFFFAIVYLLFVYMDMLAQITSVLEKIKQEETGCSASSTGDVSIDLDKKKGASQSEQNVEILTLGQLTSLSKKRRWRVIACSGSKVRRSKAT